MNIIGGYEDKVSDWPKAFLVTVVVITILLSFFASQVEMGGGEEGFQPDTEIAEANSMINERYGEEGDRITVMFVAEDNVLSRQSLLAQLELENKTRDQEEITSIMKEDANAISSPGRLIATAAFIDEAIRNRNISQDEMMRSASTLSIEELKTILNGGTLEISGSNLTFNQFEPEMITGFYENPVLAEAFPLENILEFQLSKDYNNETQTASKSLMNIAIKGDLSEDEALEGEKKLQDLSDEISEEEGLNLRILGDALVNEKINEASGRNIAILMPIAFIFVIVVLSVMYRSLTDTFLNLIALIMAIIWVYGIGVLLNLNLGSPMMTTVPVLIIGLGIDYGIHYTSRYREEIREGKGVGDAITRAGATVGFAILLTTVTTVVGFMSNVISNIETIRHFGILCSLGIISAFVLMLTFFPAAKTLIDSRRKKKGKKLVKEKNSTEKSKNSVGKKFWSMIGEPESFCEADRDCVNNGLGMGAIAARTPVRVIVVVLLITTAGVYGGIQLEAEYDFRDFLPSDLEVTETTDMLIEDFDFSQETVYILVEGDITQPEVFRKIPEVQEEAMGSDYAVDARESESPYQIAVSMVNEDSPDYDPQFNATYGKFFDDGRISEDISQENVTSIYEYMLEHREEDAVRVLDQENDEFRGVVLRIPVDTDNEENVDEVKDDMEKAAEGFEAEELDRVLVTGGPIVSQSTFQSIQDGQIQTLLITFIIALLILMGLYFYLGRGPLLGAVTILPLVFVISWTFGTMYFFDIPLNPVTVTIAAITVGLGIDYSIHLTQRFLEDTEKIEHPECALCGSASHTGSALFGSAATTVAGFAILSFAIIPPLAQFGQVSAVSITFAFLAAVFVLPTFLLMWYKFKYE